MLVRGLMILSLVFLFANTHAKNVCAVVKIRIEQELTLERQAFDASLTIQNDQATPLEDVKVTVNFKDAEGNLVKATSDTNNTDARFYLRLGELSGIDDVSGNGTLAGKSKADIHWLIIPSPGASKDQVEGELYFVGATLSYTQAGNSEEIAIGADTIRVKPTPQLTMDYFITQDVYADNPLTKGVKEIAEPFKLGVLVRNSGVADANNVKIRSAQPEIIENEQDLLIDFNIIGSKVNNDPVNTGLLVDMGRIPSNKVSSAYWIMKTTLAGTFKDITATVSHAENLGGQLTALIKADAISTHLLAGHVLNTQSGKDDVYDFLANDGSIGSPTYRLYETDGTKVNVKDLSSGATLTFARRSGNYFYYTLTLPKHDGLFFVDINDPTKHRYPVSQATQNNVNLPKGNAWTQFVREKGGTDDAEFVSRFRLFDIKSNGEYEIAFNVNARTPQPPEIVMDKFKQPVEFVKGRSQSFEVHAFDVNGDEIGLSIKNLPKGATFKRVKYGAGDVTYVFEWTPTTSGTVTLQLEAFDGNESSTEQITVNVSNTLPSKPLNYIYYDGFEE